MIRSSSCQYVVAGGSAKDGDGTLDDDGCRDFGQLPRSGGSARALSSPTCPPPRSVNLTIRHIKVDLKIGIEVWTIKNRHPSIERHPECQTQSVQWIPWNAPQALPSPPHALSLAAMA